MGTIPVAAAWSDSSPLKGADAEGNGAAEDAEGNGAAEDAEGNGAAEDAEGNGAAEDTEAMPYVIRRQRDVGIVKRFELPRVGVAFVRRLHRELRNIRGPSDSAARTLPRDRLHSVAKLRARVLIDFVFDDALVVIDEQP
jgi:hypothetical protein